MIYYPFAKNIYISEQAFHTHAVTFMKCFDKFMLHVFNLMGTLHFTYSK